MAISVQYQHDYIAALGENSGDAVVADIRMPPW